MTDDALPMYRHPLADPGRPESMQRVAWVGLKLAEIYQAPDCTTLPPRLQKALVSLGKIDCACDGETRAARE